jgi:hypothetical protein
MMKFSADMPSRLGGGEYRIKKVKAWLTTPWRFDSSSYSDRILFLFFILWGDEILADMPSRLGGGDYRINVA